MLTTYLITFILVILKGIFSILPSVSIASIPIIGTSVSSTLTIIMGYLYGFLNVFPYAYDIWHVFLVVIIPFELILIIMKFFVGSRMPTHMH